MWALGDMETFRNADIDDEELILVSDTEEYKKIEKALTPPTEEQVSEALDSYLKSVYGKKTHVRYDSENKCFTFILFNDVDYIHEKDFIKLLDDDLLFIDENLPLHLITMICRFYGVQNKEQEK